MTDEEIHNIYLHMSGKAEGLVEATGNADFPVLFARAILEYEGMTKDMQNMASKSTYKEQLETKDEPVGKFAKFTDGIWREVTDYSAGIPLYTTPQSTWVGLTEDEIKECFAITPDQFLPWQIYKRIEIKLKERNT